LAEAGFDLGFDMEKLLELELNATLAAYVDTAGLPWSRVAALASDRR
jgi:hypothetical protein